MKTLDQKKEIQNKSAKELIDLIKTEELALREFRFGLAGSKLKNIREGRAHRKQIARAKTALKTAKA